MFSGSTADSCSPKRYHDETDLLADTPIVKQSPKEVEPVLESPIRKISVEELEASVDVSFRKMESSLEIQSLKMPKEETVIEATSRKLTRERGEVGMDLDAEFQLRKVNRDTKGDFMEGSSRSLHRERCDLPPDVRQICWNELEASDIRPRKLTRDMMGMSMDSATKRIQRDDDERPFDLVSSQITRHSMGMSLDTVSRSLDSSGRAMVVDRIVETTKATPRKISREDLDKSSIKPLTREQFERLLETTSCTEPHVFGLEPSTSKRLVRDEVEMSAGSLRRRMPRMLRDDVDSSTDAPTGKITWDRMDAPKEILKHSVREELGESEPSSSSGPIRQPDVTASSQLPWKPSADVFAAGPLSQIVYDGILEKSCHTVASTPASLSASTPNLPQSRMLEVEPPLPPARAAPPMPASPPDAKEDKNKEKEKSKKSLKLKNPFKKKNESSSEKPQSGLQKL